MSFQLRLVVTASVCMALVSGCDSSHLGTPYSGTLRDTHTLYCMGRGFVSEPASLMFFPVFLLPLADLPLSAAVDSLLLPFDLALEPEARPLVVGEAGCRLIGM